MCYRRRKKCLTCVKGSKVCATCNPGYFVNPNYNKGEECDIDYSIKAVYKAEKDNEEINLLDSNYKNIIIYLVINGKKVEISNKYKFEKAGAQTTLFKTNLEEITEISGLFSNNKNTLSVETIKNFNIKTIVNMEQLLNECTSLETLIFPSLIGSKLQTIDKMFYVCSSLKIVDLGNFEGYTLSLISEMFKGCISLTSVDLSNFYAGVLTSMEGMFSDLNKLISVDFNNVKDTMYYL